VAHGNQYKDSVDGLRVIGVGCPKKGQLFWQRDPMGAVVATEDMDEKFMLLEREDG